MTACACVCLCIHDLSLTLCHTHHTRTHIHVLCSDFLRNVLRWLRLFRIRFSHRIGRTGTHFMFLTVSFFEFVRKCLFIFIFIFGSYNALQVSMHGEFFYGLWDSYHSFCFQTLRTQNNVCSWNNVKELNLSLF